MKIDLVKYNKLFLSITLVIFVLSILSMLIWGLKFGIDFKGGTIVEYKIPSRPSQNELKKIVTSENELLSLNKIIQSDDSYKLYFEPLSEEIRKKVDGIITATDNQSTRISIETISSNVGIEQSQKAIQAIALASLGIIIFLSISFRSVPKPFASWEFGVSAVMALIHDAFVVIAVFAILGHYQNVEIDSLFITAILTVIGFSVHDTIVVFDRIRENLKKDPSPDYKKIVNRSLVETLARSINLTVTALLVLFAMFVLGPESLKWFIGALLIGMISGTYSSIFVASQLLIISQDIKARLRERKR